MDLIYQLRQLNPELHILLSSTYTQTETAYPLHDRGITGFVRKPYSATSLGEIISQYLFKEST